MTKSISQLQAAKKIDKANLDSGHGKKACSLMLCLAILFVLLQTMPSQAANNNYLVQGNKENYAYSEKPLYIVGELVGIIVQSKDIGNYLAIDDGQQQYSYLGQLPENLIFEPKKTGTYRILLYDGSGNLLSENLFDVAEQADKSIQNQSQDSLQVIDVAQSSPDSSMIPKIFDNISYNKNAAAENAGIISVDKSEYHIEEKIAIGLKAGRTDIAIEVTDGKSVYSFLGLPEDVLVFVPQAAGKYTISAFDASGKLLDSIEVMVSLSGLSSDQKDNELFAKVKDDTDFIAIDISSGLQIKSADGSAMDGRMRVRKKGQVLNEKSFSEGESYDVEIVPRKSKAKRILLNGLSSGLGMDIGLDDVAKEIPIPFRGKWESVFAIDPSRLGFDSGIVTATATGQSLFKCRDWDFPAQQCYGSWEKVMDLVPGQDYNFSISPQDPGFGEANVTIINVQSYPMVGGYWTVEFTTVGNADLLISAANGTWWDDTSDGFDLRFIEVKCGSLVIPYNWVDYGPGNSTAVFQNFSCDTTSSETSKVNSPGKHTLRFAFGNDEEYAYNFALLGNIFVDTADTDFNGGTFKQTRVWGTGPDANLTLNTTNLQFQKYNLSGNFTSRLFDTGSNVSVFDRIGWDMFFPNSSDILGFVGDRDIDDLGMFLRNGSIITNISIATFANDFELRGNYVTYTIPAGMSRDDIVGFGWDDDNTNDVYAFFVNGSVAIDTDQPDLTTSIAFATTSTYTIPAGFNATNIIGFASDTDGGATAVFFNNGTKISVGSENPSFAFATIQNFSIPPGINLKEAVGVSYESGANHIAMFFRNGTFAANTSLSSLTTNIQFNIVRKAQYHANINSTTISNITLRTRMSNDTVNYSPWSNLIYGTTTGSTAIVDGYGRYLQYIAMMKSPDQFITPYLLNLSVNYSRDIVAPIITEATHRINNSRLGNNQTARLSVNVTDNSGSINITVFTLNDTNHTALDNYPIFFFDWHCNETRLTRYYTWNSTFANDSVGFYDLNLTVNLSWYCDGIIPIINGSTIRANDTLVKSGEKVKINASIYDDTNIVNFSIFTINFTNYTASRLGSQSYYEWTCLNEGNYFFTDAYANDSINNLASNSSIQLNWTCDTAAPVVKLLVPDNNSILLNQTINFTYSYYEISGLQSGCRLVINDSLNATGPAEAESDTNTNITANLTDGIYQWSVNCTDNLGQVGTNDSLYLLTIDTHTPEINLIEPVNNTFNGTSNEITFYFNISSELMTVNSCELIINNSINNTVAGPVPKGAPQAVVQVLGNGNYRWNINCTDSNGFEGSSPIFNLTVLVINDTTPPTIELLSPPNNTFFNYSMNLSFFYLPSDTTGIANCSFNLNDTLNTSSNNITVDAVNNFTVNVTNPGVFKWHLNCADNTTNSNTKQSEFRLYIVDLTLPSEFNLSSPANNTITTNLSPYFVWNTTNETYFSNYTLQVDDNEDFSSPEYTNYSYAISNTSLVVPLATNTVWFWRVKAYDNASNVRYSSKYYVYIADTLPPTVINLSVNDSDLVVRSDYRLNFSLNATDLNGIKNVTLNGTVMMGNGPIFFTVNSTSEFNCTGEQTCLFTIYAYDMAGNLNATQSFFIEVDDVPPAAFSLQLPANGTESRNQSPNFNWSEATDSHFRNYTLLIDDSNDFLAPLYNYGNNGSSSMNSFVLPLNLTVDQMYYWMVIAYDIFDNIRNATDYFVYIVDNSTPNVSLVSPANNTVIANSSIVTFVYSVNDTYSINNCSIVVNDVIEAITTTPPVIEKSSNISVQAALGNGAYYWYVQCYDNAGNSNTSQPLYFNVSVPSPIVKWINAFGGSTDPSTAFVNFSEANDGQENSRALSISSGVVAVMTNATTPSGIGRNGMYIPRKSSVTFGATVSSTSASAAISWQLFYVNQTQEVLLSQYGNITVGGLSLTTTAKTNYTAVGNLTPNSNIYLDSSINLSMRVFIIYNGGGSRTYTLYWEGPSETFANLSAYSLGFLQTNLSFPATDVNISENMTMVATCNISCQLGYCLATQVELQMNTSSSDFATVNSAVGNLVLNDSSLDNPKVLGTVNTTAIQVNFTLRGNVLSTNNNLRCVASSDYSSINGTKTIKVGVRPGDILINSSLITFSTSTASESENVTVFAEIRNIGYVPVNRSFNVSFHWGSGSASQIMNNRTIVGLAALESKTVNVSFLPIIGNNTIVVKADLQIENGGTISEDNETNNIANNSIYVPMYNLYYGSSQLDIVLGSFQNETVAGWQNTTLSLGNIYIIDAQSEVQWDSLVALGRNLTGYPQQNDFAELDTAINTSSFNDSINRTWLSSGDPHATANFTVFSNTVYNVSVVNSTNNSNFITGIVWDSSDASQGEFDGTQDVIFVSKVNQQMLGKYGISDFEFRVPSRLKEFLPPIDTVTFYVELI